MDGAWTRLGGNSCGVNNNNNKASKHNIVSDLGMTTGGCDF